MRLEWRFKLVVLQFIKDWYLTNHWEEDEDRVAEVIKVIDLTVNAAENDQLGSVT